jgi:hypothetical protein
VIDAELESGHIRRALDLKDLQDAQDSASGWTVTIHLDE